MSSRHAPKSRATEPVHTPISHCKVWHFTYSIFVFSWFFFPQRAVTSCSILISVSLISAEEELPCSADRRPTCTTSI